MGLFDLSHRHASPETKKDPLVETDAVVPCEEFRPVLERAWRKPEAERKPIDAVLMFKTMVPSALYNLSDDRIGYRLRDRLSFMRFLGLGLEDGVPDARTVWLYREALAGKVEELFSQFDAHLARQGDTLACTSGMERAGIGMKNLACNMRRLGRLRRLAPCPA